ncbi:GAF and ANTAR domain-containing protein [Williamsia serinedens]|uniref:GAF domain-containing protein n=1 Tax=Williamsia serinedens TaxID=391736 RepID=A0ABT1H6N8_9NOCA|nr:GAF and ANTAR domain-containing protein [Williamsia serinedens]MCP2162295.1 GAF domain-containing protein [Williamsia serinedens]
MVHTVDDESDRRDTAPDLYDDHLEVHTAIARLARQLHGIEARGIDPSAVLAEVTHAAVTLLPAVDHSGITLVSRRRGVKKPYLESTAPTGPVPERLDALQHTHDEGPCYEAVWEHETIEVPDMDAERRWPSLTAAILGELPVRSSLSIQLYVSDLDMGALNLYSERSHALDDETRDLAHILATHAAVAISGARRSSQFRSALASRDIIGQAKGMLMERFDIDAVRAFDLIRKLSQNTNTRLSEVAERLVHADHPPLSRDREHTDTL